MYKNFFKRLIDFAIVLIALLVPMLILCGCGTKNKDYKEYSNSRFIFVGEYEQIETPNGNDAEFYLLVDKETRIIYLYPFLIASFIS